ncbi:hypothetical protein I5F16_19565 [Bacillus halotolerans]|nr:hypothetical protein [Bacillus halotolerans]MBV5121533.1 hypothetical protein [Bacillus halotolerans]
MSKRLSSLHSKIGLYALGIIDIVFFTTGEMKRYKKDSFEWYKNVIQTNGEEL